MTWPFSSNNQAEAKPKDQAIKKVYIPSVEACWDYGFTRNEPMLPFISSLLPYSFLRGVQFDTKVFKIWEFVAANQQNAKGIVTGLNARNELIITLPDESNIVESINKNLEKINIPTASITSGGDVVQTIKTPKKLSDEEKNAINYLNGAQLHIALDSDSELTTRISNTWSGGEDILTQAIQGVATIAMNVNEIFRTIGQTTSGKDYAGVPFSPLRFKGTENGTITINFTLFTKNNYIRDIYIPLMFLKTLCYAKSNEWTDSAGDFLTKGFSSAFDRLTSNINQQTKKEISDKLNDVGVNAENVQKFAQFAGDRFKVLTPPPLLKIEHSSGIVYMNKGAVTEFSYKADGPWVRMHYDGLFGKIYGNIDSATGAALDRLLQDTYVKFPSAVDCCYPTRVKCSMTIKETDFITLETHRERELEKILGQIQTGFASLGASSVPTSELIAGGIAQNLGTVIPQTKGAGDLLSGGKWVPPGESLTGVSGFF